MLRASKLLLGLGLVIILGTTACVKPQDDDGMTVSERNAKVRKANVAIDKANALISTIRIEEDDIARDRRDAEHEGNRIHYVKLRERYQLLNQRYSALDRTISKELMKDLLLLKEYTTYNKLRQIQTQSADNQSNNALHLVILELKILSFDAPKQPAQPVPARVHNPIVAHAEGGYIKGVVKDSISGNVIANAQVGFREPDEREYFYTTNTNSQGAYVSPPLSPGEYAIDIKQGTYLISRRAQVEVTRGAIAQENVSLTTRVEDGQYRITMSWTGPAAGAVKDVDSYLKIPGVADPLYFGIVQKEYNGSHLDKDDTDWGGPETVTIKKVFRGTYSYYVNNYNYRSQLNALGESAVRVQVYSGDRLVRSYSVPRGDGLTYEVFRIVDGQIQDVQRYDKDRVLPTH